MRTIRWGILGCGDVCEVKSGPAFRKAPHSALVAVMRRDRALAEDYARRHGVPRWYGEAESLVSDREVDAIYVATPPSTHLELTLLAIGARKPVYVEKPMARTHGECLAMISAAAEAGVPLFVAYYRRMLPRFLKVKELLDGGAIGEVRSVSVTLSKPTPPTPPGAVPWRLDPEIAGAGLFLDLASHTLDLLDFLLGPATDARGRAANVSRSHAVEDVVSAEIVHPGGVLMTGLWNFATEACTDRVEILGSRGSLVFATFDDAPVRWAGPGGLRELDIPHPPHIQQPLIESLVLELNGAGKCPSTGETAARTSAVMDAILADFRAGAARSR